MLGFKEDFESWRSPLALEEREMVQFQAAGEFNKKFWKPEEFKKDLPEEKVKSFSKILANFFDVEAADYNKEVEAKVPSYKLFKKAGDKVLAVAMSGRSVEIDRDADRRYEFATRKMKMAAEKGEMFPQSSPMREVWDFTNDDAKPHTAMSELMKSLKEASKAAKDLSKERKQAAAKMSIPPMGEYHAARDEVESDVEVMESFLRSQTADRYRTKADVLRSFWAELPKYSNEPAPPLDDVMLADLEEAPAVQEGEFRRSRGVADKLYKSDAIGAFGIKHLLGV